MPIERLAVDQPLTPVVPPNTDLFGYAIITGLTGQTNTMVDGATDDWDWDDVSGGGANSLSISRLRKGAGWEAWKAAVVARDPTAATKSFNIFGTIWYGVTEGIMRGAAVASTATVWTVGGTGADTAVTCTFTATTVDAVAHGMVANKIIQFTNTGGGLPADIATNTNYYVLSTGLTADAFRIALTAGGTPLDFTDAGTGTHSFHYTLSFNGSTAVPGTTLSGGVYTLTRDIHAFRIDVRSGAMVKLSTFNLFVTDTNAATNVVDWIHFRGTACAHFLSMFDRVIMVHGCPALVIKRIKALCTIPTGQQWGFWCMSNWHEYGTQYGGWQNDICNYTKLHPMVGTAKADGSTDVIPQETNNWPIPIVTTSSGADGAAVFAGGAQAGWNLVGSTYTPTAARFHTTISVSATFIVDCTAFEVQAKTSITNAGTIKGFKRGLLPTPNDYPGLAFGANGSGHLFLVATNDAAYRTGALSIAAKCKSQYDTYWAKANDNYPLLNGTQSLDFFHSDNVYSPAQIDGAEPIPGNVEAGYYGTATNEPTITKQNMLDNWRALISEFTTQFPTATYGSNLRYIGGNVGGAASGDETISAGGRHPELKRQFWEHAFQGGDVPPTQLSQADVLENMQVAINAGVEVWMCDRPNGISSGIAPEDYSVPEYDTPNHADLVAYLALARSTNTVSKFFVGTQPDGTLESRLYSGPTTRVPV